MQKTLEVGTCSQMIGLASDITYMQKPYWGGCSNEQLRLSFMTARHTNASDRAGMRPLLIFLCGGAWQQVDRNVWIPNLVYFAEHGFAVASVDYSTHPYTQHPDQICEVKTAIRYLRARAGEMHIDPDKVAIMGESAGAYLAGLAALTGGDAEYGNGWYPDQSDAVGAAVTMYSPTDVSLLDNSALRIRTDSFPDLTSLVTSNAPPYLLLHGEKDPVVPWSQSGILHEKLEEFGVRNDFYLIKNATHGDVKFMEPEVKRIILDFLYDALEIKEEK